MPEKKAAHPRPSRLFSEPEAPRDFYTANIDGAARGNPGPASYAVVLRSPDGSVAARLSKYIGRATNNVAEYFGLIAALDAARERGITRLRVLSDSELLVRQMHGRYKVKSPDLRPLFERARKLAAGLAHFSIEHVRRERNADADALANQALDGVASPAAGRQPPDTSRQSSVVSHPSEQSDGKAAGAAGRRIRARVRSGALVPEQPLDLADGEIVELTLHSQRRTS